LAAGVGKVAAAVDLLTNHTTPIMAHLQSLRTLRTLHTTKKSVFGDTEGELGDSENESTRQKMASVETELPHSVEVAEFLHHVGE
jgi:hypothetical protein